MQSESRIPRRERCPIERDRIHIVSKSYPVYSSPSDRLKELASFNRLKRHNDFWALHDVTLSRWSAARPFASSAKTAPARARCCRWSPEFSSRPPAKRYVHGRVSALLELGAGFNPEFTGRDNVYLNGSILGLTRKQIDERYKDIEAFAEIGDFIDQPVKTYSSGMVVRLAFAVAIHVDPEILLVDEALAVGDIYFRQRCMRKVHELRAARHHDPLRLACDGRREGDRRPRAVARTGTKSGCSGRPTRWWPSTWPR